MVLKKYNLHLSGEFPASQGWDRILECLILPISQGFPHMHRDWFLFSSIDFGRWPLSKMEVHSFLTFSFRWFCARLQYLPCVRNGYTAVLHWATDIFYIDCRFCCHLGLLSRIFVAWKDRAVLLSMFKMKTVTSSKVARWRTEPETPTRH